MAQEFKGRFRGREFTIKVYTPVTDPKKDFDKYRSDIEGIEREIGTKSRRFREGNEKASAILKSFGASEVIIDYASDNFVNWERSDIVRASVVSGAEAQSFLEFCLENIGGGLGLMMRRTNPARFEDIPFKVSESEEGRRTVSLIAGTSLPQLLWRELFNVFVMENAPLVQVALPVS